MSDNNLILIVDIVVVIFLIVSINNKKNKKKYSTNSVNNCTENFDQYSAPAPAPYANLVYRPDNLNSYDNQESKKFNPYTPSAEFTAQAGQGFNLGVDTKDPNLERYFSQAPPPKTAIISDDLLPKKNENWFETPSVGSKLDDANLLADAIFKVGVDTVGNTKKNPSYDIRGTIANPKFPISPWNNSSYEPDNNLRSLC